MEEGFITFLHLFHCSYSMCFFLVCTSNLEFVTNKWFLVWERMDTLCITKIHINNNIMTFYYLEQLIEPFSWLGALGVAASVNAWWCKVATTFSHSSQHWTVKFVEVFQLHKSNFTKRSLSIGTSNAS